MSEYELKVGTAFSGIGAPECAINELGIKHRNVFACELDKYARQTYLANFKPEQMFEDFKKMDYSLIEQLDLCVFGFPCQTFSIAGKRKGFDEVRGTLFFNCAEFIKINQPKMFILENVKGLLSHDKPKGSKSKYGRTFNTITGLLAATVNYQETMFPFEDNLGYNIHYKVLNAKNFGSPQNRERIFIIGIRPDLPNKYHFPKGEPLKLRLKDILEPVVDEKYYLSDKILKGFAKHNVNHKAKGTGFIFSPIYSIDGLSPTVTAKQGGGHEPFIQEGDDVICHNMQPRSADRPSLKYSSGGSGHLQRGDGLTYCLDTGATNAVEIKGTGRIRRLTPLECMRLQSFPDTFIRICSDSQQYKQFGNSINVNCIRAVIKNLLGI